MTGLWRLSFLFAAVFLPFAVASAQAETPVAPGALVREASETRERLAAADENADAAAMVFALEDLVRLERALSREFRTVVRFARVEDFNRAAELTAANPELAARLSQIRPVWTRGARDGPMISVPVHIGAGGSTVMVVTLEADDPAWVYVRNADPQASPGNLRLRLRRVGDTVDGCTSVVSRGWPACHLHPEEEADYEIHLESLNGDAQDLMVWVN